MARASQTITVELEDFLTGFAPDVRNLALALRDLVFEIEPNALEQIDVPAHLLAYGYAKTYAHLVCVVSLYGEYVNLGFPRGVDLPDPEGLLEGSGKQARHVKIEALSQAESPEISAMVQASVDITPRPEE
ncbi:MAG TPA: DUF1801 domain-containing protein [Anaerolineales bacterium]|nr:DUF1801 domain-containing protein [Anaerolineales bacterium]